MIVFEHPHNVDLSSIELDEGECTFLNKSDLNSDMMMLVDELRKAAGEEWVLTELKSSPWLHVMRGPVEGIDWHDEGVREDNYSLVYALNDSPAALEFEDRILEHKKGRAVMFKSSTLHRVQMLTTKDYRYALAFLLHGGKNE